MASSRSGTISRTAKTSFETASTTPRRRVALQTPIGTASSHARKVAVPVRRSVARMRSPRRGATGPLYASEYPKSPARGGRDPLPVADEKRPVQPCGTFERGHGFGRDARIDPQVGDSSRRGQAARMQMRRTKPRSEG